MAALYKILKSATRIHHLRCSRISFIAKHFSCTPSRRDYVLKPAYIDKQVKVKHFELDEAYFADFVLDFVMGARPSRHGRLYFPDHSRVYTDASSRSVEGEGGKRAGVGVFSEDVADIQGKFRAKNETTSDRAESLGVLAALHLIGEAEKKNPSDRKYLLMTDHQDTVDKIEKWETTNDDVILKIRDHYAELRDLNVEVVFSWIPGHFGVPGHREAELLARDLKEPKILGEKMTLPNKPASDGLDNSLARYGSAMNRPTSKIIVNSSFNIIEQSFPWNLTYYQEYEKLEKYIDMLKTGAFADIPRVIAKTDTRHKYEENIRVGFGIRSNSYMLRMNRYYYLDRKEHKYDDAVSNTICIMVALKAVLSQLEDEKYKYYKKLMQGKPLMVFSDSQLGIDNLTSGWPQRPDVVDRIRNLMTELMNLHGIDVGFSWYPTPPGLPGNRRADELAHYAVFNDTIYGLFKDFGPGISSS